MLVKLIKIVDHDINFDPICCNLESDLYDSWYKKLKGEAKIKKKFGNYLDAFLDVNEKDQKFELLHWGCCWHCSAL